MIVNLGQLCSILGLKLLLCNSQSHWMSWAFGYFDWLLLLVIICAKEIACFIFLDLDIKDSIKMRESFSYLDYLDYEIVTGYLLLIIQP